MSFNYVVDEAEERVREHFKNNVDRFTDTVDAKIKEIEQNELETHEDGPSGMDEEAIRSFFYKELVGFLGTENRQDFAILAENFVMDDIVHDIIDEYYDAFCVLYGVK